MDKIILVGKHMVGGRRLEIKKALSKQEMSMIKRSDDTDVWGGGRDSRRGDRGDRDFGRGGDSRRGGGDDRDYRGGNSGGGGNFGNNMGKMMMGNMSSMMNNMKSSNLSHNAIYLPK